MPRTFGLQRQAGAGSDGPSVPVTRAQIRRVLRHFRPYWAQWVAILLCVAVNAGLAVLPPLCVRGILDNAIPGKDMHLLYLLVGAMVGLAVATNLVGVLRNYLSTRLGVAGLVTEEA
jgi:ATP-binding cassette, subfamily B, bacterial